MKKKGIIVTTIIILLICLIIPAISYSLDTIEKINMILPASVYVDTTNVGNQPLKEAEKNINESIEELLSRQISIIFNNQDYPQVREFNLRDLGYRTNKDEIIQSIAAILENELSLIDKYKNYKNIEENGKHLELEVYIDRDVFMDTLKAFDESHLPKPVNAEYKYEDDSVKIIEGSVGYVFDKDKLYDELVQNIDDLTIDKAYLTLKEVNPDITTEGLRVQGIKEKIASFTTKFNPTNQTRSANIRLAVGAVDGTILAPGDVFSFNEIVGERTAKRGYQEAGVYIKGKVEQGIGGGICQVSTTLYNAVLISDLEVVERSNHTLTVPYVPLSQDASVNWGTKDLKFKNNTDHYIYVHAETGENDVTFDLFGTKSNKRIVLKSVTLSTTAAPVEYKEDNTLLVGQEVIEDKGHVGYKSQLIKYIYEGDKLISSDTINYDIYRTTPKIVKKGIKPVEKIEQAPIVNTPIDNNTNNDLNDIVDNSIDESI